MKAYDSLLLVQNKLVTVIDTMAGVITQDRKRIAELEREVARLRSMMESRAYSSPRASTQAQPPVPQQSQAAPLVTPQVQQQRDLTGAPVPSQPEPQQQAAPEPAPQNTDYTNALRLFNDGKYIDALAAFDELSRRDASSPLAPNYVYWKGESLYAMGEYKEAIRSFHSLLEQYGHSSKADDAEFKIGAAYEKLGDVTNARTAYQRLILSFPESEYRNRAEIRLQKLK
jgi:tol-pal system protein YbgF